MSAHHRFDDDRHGHHHHPHPFDQFFFDFEHFGHHHNDHLPPTLLDATVAGNATDDHGHILNGTGNPADGWEIQNNGDFQLAADVHYRQGDTVQPVAVTADGWLVYSMPDGPQKQDSEHGVPTDNSGRAATSFDWSFDTGTHQTIQEFLASSGEFIVKIDLNPGQHNDPLVLHAVYDDTINTGGSHVVWEDSHGNVWVPDDAGTPYVTQNSQNYAFFQGLLHTSAVGPAGVFDIEEEIIAPHHNVVADIHSVLQIGDASVQTDCHTLPVTHLNATVAFNATKGDGTVLNGSGNPADGWEIQNNGNFQLATDVHYRQGDTVQPSAVTDKGVLIYNMPAHEQVADPVHHVPADSGPHPHAATSFDYSFDTAAGSGSPQTIQDFLASGGQFIFKIDLDPGQHNDPLVLHAVFDNTINSSGSGVVWEDAQNHVIIADDAGTPYVTQNSQNYAFYQAIIDTDPHTPGVQPGPVGPAGTFDIEEQIVSPHHHEMIADIHSTLVLA